MSLCKICRFAKQLSFQVLNVLLRYQIAVRCLTYCEREIVVDCAFERFWFVYKICISSSVSDFIRSVTQSIWQMNGEAMLKLERIEFFYCEGKLTFPDEMWPEQPSQRNCGRMKNTKNMKNCHILERTPDLPPSAYQWNKIKNKIYI